VQTCALPISPVRDDSARNLISGSGQSDLLGQSAPQRSAPMASILWLITPLPSTPPFASSPIDQKQTRDERPPFKSGTWNRLRELNPIFPSVPFPHSWSSLQLSLRPLR